MGALPGSADAQEEVGQAFVADHGGVHQQGVMDGGVVGVENHQGRAELEHRRVGAESRFGEVFRFVVAGGDPEGTGDLALRGIELIQGSALMLVNIVEWRTFVHAHDLPHAPVGHTGRDPSRFLRTDRQPEQRRLAGQRGPERLILREVQGVPIHLRRQFRLALHEGAGRDLIPSAGRHDGEFLSRSGTLDPLGNRGRVVHELPRFFEGNGENMVTDAVTSFDHTAGVKSWRAWSRVRASSIRKPPVRVRHRASRWAPVSRASPRSRAKARM